MSVRSGCSFWLVGAAGWIVLLAIGWYALLRYEFTAGSGGQVGERWPAESRLPLDHEQPTLVMFAHRHCPCTRQSLGELEQILVRTLGQVRAWVILLAPPDAAADRVGEDIESLARSLPGVQVAIDSDGVEARRFHVKTSGHVLLYDPQGQLLFSGGITDARGHAGESVGRRIVLAWLQGEIQEQRAAPVYGCSLFDEEEKKGESWKR